MDSGLKQVLDYDWKNINQSLDSMRVMFDLVRLVDAEECREINIDDKGELRFGKECYAVWNADHRCANCTSFQACHSGQRKNRVEYFNGKQYQIQSVPVRVTLSDDTVYSCNMELINFSNLLVDDASDPDGEKDRTAKDERETGGYLTSHDKLTGILNWDGFCKRARQLISDNPDEKRVIVSANIKDFKLVNSLFGRNKGDEVLIEIANIMCEYCTEKSAYARTGGNTFALCAPKVDNIEELIAQGMSRIKALIDSPSYRLNIYAGIYEMDNANLPISIMYDRSYMALQSIRNNREKILAWFDESMLKTALHEQKVISDFENNLRSGQFVIYLQPQVNNAGKVEGAECLVRWILPNGNMVPPFEFIGILEQSDLIASLDRYVWELAARQLDSWKNTEFSNVYLSVNVSPQDFYYMDVADIFTELCKKYDISAKMLHVEITETAVADETQNNKATIEMLQKNGFIVEIDDFGKGSSSLSLLKDIKADVLKIDMGFLRQSENTQRGTVILESVVDMAKRLNMEVISEGIETEGQFKNLMELGCDMYQGYYFSKPIPVAAFEDMVKGGSDKGAVSPQTS